MSKSSTLALLALAALAACSSKSVTIPELTSTLISASTGGVAKSADGDVVVTVPAHALSADTHLDIYTDRTNLPAKLLAPVYELRPLDLALAKPIDLAFTVHATARRPAIADVSSGGAMIVLGSIFDAAKDAASAEISKLGRYSLVDQAVTSTTVSTSTPTMTPAYTSTAPVDFLFVIDNSASIDSKQARLIASADAFIRAIAVGRDYQIGVVTTDRTNSVERSGVTTPMFESHPPFAITNLDVSMCMSALTAMGCLRGPDPTTRLLKSGAMNTEAQIAAFRANANVGSCGSGIEQGLKGAVSSIEFSAPGKCNEGLLRPGAELVIVIMSDENDTDDTPVSNFADEIGALKDYAKVRVAVIVAEENGVASNCSTSRGTACGSLCQNPPAAGSLTPCTSPGQCMQPGESCTNTGTTSRCDNPDHVLFGPDTCASCTFFDTPDCCEATAANNPRKGELGRYLEFARILEQRIAPRAHLPMTGCQPSNGPTACLIETICQDSFAATLERIARL